MADKIIENNQVSMMGKIAAGFTFSHQVFGEGFYMTELYGEKAQRFRGQDSGNGFGTADRCDTGLYWRVCRDSRTVPFL